jgi:hypothetical protein
MYMRQNSTAVAPDEAEHVPMKRWAPESLLRRFGGELFAVLLEESSVIGDGLVDLAVGDGGEGRGWGHGLCHGVIPFCYVGGCLSP